jgi:hypothetical protein
VPTADLKTWEEFLRKKHWAYVRIRGEGLQRGMGGWVD